MRRLRWILSRLFNRRAHENELKAELQSTFDLMVAEQVASGLSPNEALASAQREMGNVDTVRESVRDAWSGAAIEQCWRDVRYALRGLRRDPIFAVAAVLTFGLAIGGTSAVATLTDSILVRSLPYAESDRLMMVFEANQSDPESGFVVAAPNVDDWRKRNQDFEGIAFYEYLTFNLAGTGDTPQQISGIRTSHELFALLRATPLLGRALVRTDDEGRNGSVVVLSHALWRARFNGDSAVVGRHLRINNVDHTIVGVMRAGFTYPSTRQKLWVPIALTENDRQRGAHSFFAVARLKPGVTATQAKADMRRIGDMLSREYPQENANETATVVPLREVWMRDMSRILTLLIGAVLLICVMATVNVSGLLLARGGARRREWAARLALGGSRARLVGQQVTESVVIALLGGVVGIAIAYVAVPILVAQPGLHLDSIPFRDLTNVGLNVRLLLFAFVLALLAGVVAGAVPALFVIPRSPGDLLRGADVRGATVRHRNGLRGTLLAVEVGIAVVVLVGAGLLVHSMQRVLRVDPGLDPKQVYALTMTLPQTDTYGVPERPLFCSQLHESVGTIPGILSVSAVSHLPMSGANAGRGFAIEGLPDPGQGNQAHADYGVVCPDYFHTMGVPVLAGIDFSARDVAASPAVVMVNDALRQRYFPNTNPVGKRIRFGSFQSPNRSWLTIIGVIGDIHHFGLTSRAEPYLYKPYTQAVWPEMSVVIRTRTSTSSTLVMARERLTGMIKDAPVGEPVAMDQVMADSLGAMRFPLLMMLAFATIAGVLTIVGVFGVASQVLVQRVRELGIRRALGATPRNLHILVLIQTLRPVGLGLVGGLLVARWASKFIGSLLYDVAPTDFTTFAGMALLLGAFTFAACVAPAHRAANVDPADTLRND